MKLSILSGAYKNAGDFLITERSLLLLKYVFKDVEFIIYKRNVKLDDKIDDLNRTNAVIFAGGPFYNNNFYKKTVPFVENIEDIKVPIYTLGGGVYSKRYNSEYIYENYKFDEKTKKFFLLINKYNKLSCRDFGTVRFLKNNGLCETIMTGCPAFYNIEYLINKNNRSNNYKIKKICISDCGNVYNLPLCIKIIKYIKNRYKSAFITFVFQRGFNKDNYTDVISAKYYEKYKKIIETLEISVVDISYSADGYKIFDDCDLHIGMRVHSHIYNISKGTPSLLIEEDARGSGINEVLGLPHIRAYDEKFSDKDYVSKAIRRIYKKFGDIETQNKEHNKYLINEIDDYLTIYESTNFQMIKCAVDRIKYYFEIMLDFIKGWNI